MRVLIAFERSGVSRRAFRENGFSAWSCDVVAADDGSPYHIKDTFQHVLAKDPLWDLIIAHPPCTYLSNSGVRWLHEKPGRWEDMREAAELFQWTLEAPICPVAVENPVMHGHAGIRKPDFTVQPWQFGDNFKKRTCFWTKGLPPLIPTSDLDGSTAKAEVHRCPPGPERARIRSQTYPGLAAAMADQWGSFIASEAAA